MTFIYDCEALKNDLTAVQLRIPKSQCLLVIFKKYLIQLTDSSCSFMLLYILVSLYNTFYSGYWIYVLILVSI